MFYFLGVDWRYCGPRARAQRAYLNCSRKTNIHSPFVCHLFDSSQLKTYGSPVIWLPASCLNTKHVETGTIVCGEIVIVGSSCIENCENRCRSACLVWPVGGRESCVHFSIAYPHIIKHHIRMPAKLAVELVFINFTSMMAAIWTPRSKCRQRRSIDHSNRIERESISPISCIARFTISGPRNVYAWKLICARAEPDRRFICFIKKKQAKKRKHIVKSVLWILNRLIVYVRLRQRPLVFPLSLSMHTNLNVNILASHAIEIDGDCTGVFVVVMPWTQKQLCLCCAWIYYLFNKLKFMLFLSILHTIHMQTSEFVFRCHLNVFAAFMDSVILFAFNINSIFCVQTKATHSIQFYGDSVEYDNGKIDWMCNKLCRRRYNSIEPRQRNQSSSSCSTCSQRRISLWTIIRRACVYSLFY